MDLSSDAVAIIVWSVDTSTDLIVFECTFLKMLSPRTLGVHTLTVLSAEPVTRQLSPNVEHVTGCLCPKNFNARIGGVRFQQSTCGSSEVMATWDDYLLNDIERIGLFVVLNDSISWGGSMFLADYTWSGEF